MDDEDQSHDHCGNDHIICAGTLAIPAARRDFTPSGALRWLDLFLSAASRGSRAYPADCLGSTLQPG
jgi:hypothetical protein